MRLSTALIRLRVNGEQHARLANSFAPTSPKHLQEVLPDRCASMPLPDAADNPCLSGGVYFDAIWIQFLTTYCGLQSFVVGSSTQNNFDLSTWDTGPPNLRATKMSRSSLVFLETLAQVSQVDQVKVVLCRRTHDERLKTTVVVIKLDPNGIEVHTAGEHGVIRSIRVGALRRSGQVVLLGGALGEVGAKLVGKGGIVLTVDSKSKSKPSTTAFSEGTVDRAVG